jgi:hypothetical protein
VKQQTLQVVGDLLLLSNLILSMPFVNQFGDVIDRDSDSIEDPKRREVVKFSKTCLILLRSSRPE